MSESEPGENRRPRRPREPGQVADINANLGPDAIKLGPDIERMTNQACEALLRDLRTFCRGGTLVTTILTEGGNTSIRVMPLPTLRERLSSVASWWTIDARMGQWKRTIPPEIVTQAVLARGQWDGIRPLVSVVLSPSLRPDGTILQEPGYDTATSVLYCPRAECDPVPEHPSQAHAKAAAIELLEVVQDFPFAGEEHRSAWLAGVLTMFARGAIDGPVPMFAVDATTRGTGKGLLMDAAMRIAYGSDIAHTSLPKDDDEMRKRIMSTLIGGDPSVCLDNISSRIELPSLDALLTSTTWRDRILGATSMVGCPSLSIWWATGNNLDFGGDLSRRTLHIRMESDHECPEERTDFAHPNLLQWIGENRPRLAACALTILRAYCVAKKPRVRQGTPWGSFQNWADLIGNAVVWCGLADPLLARATKSQGSEADKDDLIIALMGIRTILSRRAGFLSSRGILDAIYRTEMGQDKSQLREAVEALCRCKDGKQPSPLQFSGMMRRYRGRVVDGMRFKVASVDSHTRGTNWTVEVVAKPATVIPTAGHAASEAVSGTHRVAAAAEPAEDESEPSVEVQPEECEPSLAVASDDEEPIQGW